MFVLQLWNQVVQCFEGDVVDLVECIGMYVINGLVGVVGQGVYCFERYQWFFEGGYVVEGD